MAQVELQAILVAACCFLACCWAAAWVRHRNRYPSVPAKVVRVSVTSKSTSEGAIHRLDISYRYSVQGKHYVGHSLGHFLGNYFHSRKGAEAQEKRLPVGQTILVRYNPKDPNESFIPQRSLPWILLSLGPLGVLLSLVVIVLATG